MSHKGRQKKKDEQIEDFSLEDRLRSLDGKEMCVLVQVMMVKLPEARRLTLEWFKNRAEDTNKTIQERGPLNEELLWEYWNNARTIISKFNEYGGGPYEEEDEAYDWLNKVLELIEEGNMSTDVKFEFLDDAFEEYDVGNSGFEDGLMDIFFEICETKEEWEYLVKKLGKHPSDWRKHLIMEINKNHLRDDKAYLKMRIENLHYGLNYWDLIEFYLEKGEMQKALKTAEQGILNGKGRCTELFQFLFDHFAKKRDATNLERVVQTALTRGTEEKEMLDRLFDYYKAQGDYESAKEALVKAFWSLRQGDYYAEYKRMKKFLKAADWKLIEPRIFKEIREKNIHDYMHICLDKNMKKEVLNTILNPPRNRWGYLMINDFDEFADDLKEDFPEKIIEYHWQKAYCNIPNGNRNTYRTAAGHLAKIKHIYTYVLKDVSRWEWRFSALKKEFKNRPAFLDEVREL